MKPEPLTAEELATLPPIRPRWQAHLGGAVGALVGLGELWLMRAFIEWAGPVVRDWEIHWTVVLPVAIVTGALPWLLASRLLFSLGYDWFHVVLMSVLSFVVPFITWGVGFRLVRRPYRDWRPSPRQRQFVRPVPGTGYHVLQSDLTRYSPIRPDSSVPAA